MAKLKREAFIESLKEMNIKEVMELVDAMKEAFGIDPTAVAVAASTADEEEVKTEVNLLLKSFGGNKVAIIKIVKEITGVGLMDAKKIVESAPVNIKEAIKVDEAEELKKKLVDAGAEVDIV